MARYNKDQMFCLSKQFRGMMKHRDVNALAKNEGAPNIKTLENAAAGQPIGIDKLAWIAKELNLPLYGSVNREDSDRLKVYFGQVNLSDKPLFPDFQEFGNWSAAHAEAYGDELLPLETVIVQAHANLLTSYDIRAMLTDSSLLRLTTKRRADYQPPSIFQIFSTFSPTAKSLELLKTLQPAISVLKVQSDSLSTNLDDLLESVVEPLTDVQRLLAELKTEGVHILGVNARTTVFDNSNPPNCFGLIQPIFFVASSNTYHITFTYRALKGYPWGDIWSYERDNDKAVEDLESLIQKIRKS